MDEYEKSFHNMDFWFLLSSVVCIEVCHKSRIRHSTAAAELLKSSFPTSLFYTDFLVHSVFMALLSWKLVTVRAFVTVFT